jgi:hypothetical protein
MALLLDALLPSHPIFWHNALSLNLSAFLALEIPSIAYAPCLTPPAVQTRCVLRALALVGRVRARRGADLHVDDAVRIGRFPHIAAMNAWR